MNLTAFDWIVVNTSGGKDSQAMMHVVCTMAKAQGVLDRVVAVHAALGRVEWKEAKEIAELHAQIYGVRFETVSRKNGDLLQQVRERRMWPDSKNRYCTSDQKRDQVTPLFTKLCFELKTNRRVQILNCMGFRAEESSARAKRQELSIDKRTSSGNRQVTVWLPIFRMTLLDVWAMIKASRVPHHFAYDLGMPRLSCCFCIFAPKSALMLAGKHNPELLDEYVALEQEIGHTFRNKFKIEEVRDALARGEQHGSIQSWTM